MRHKKINPAKSLNSTPCCPAFLLRFFAKVRASSTHSYYGTPCWEWQGHTDEEGYGQVKFAGRTHWAHRVACAVFNRQLRDGEEVDHKCHNHACVNPRHLRPLPMRKNRPGRGAVVVEEGAPF